MAPMQWRQKSVDDTKAAIKQLVDPLQPEQARQFLSSVIQQRHALGKESLGRFIACISLLLLHERASVLSPTQIQRVSDLALMLLHAEGINPQKSALRYLYWELHTATSIVMRKSGRAFASTWEHLSGGRFAPNEAYQELGHGLRMLRLGNGAAAWKALIAAQHLGLPQQQNTLAVLNRCVLLRLNGHIEECYKLIDQALAHEANNQRQQMDLHWEFNCCEALELKSARAFSRLSHGRRATFITAPYVLEAYLWRMLFGRPKDQLPDLHYLRKRFKLNFALQESLYKMVSKLMEVHDELVPLDLRLRSLGNLIETRSELPTIDKEWLLLSIALRWLRRHNFHAHSDLIQQQYDQLQQRLNFHGWDEA